MKTKKFLPSYFIIFGATGDLSKKKLLPALYLLEKNKNFEEETKIISIGRKLLTQNEYEKITKQNIEFFLQKKINEKIWKKFKKRIIFLQMNILKITDFLKLKKNIQLNFKTCIYYLAVPSEILENILNGLSFAKINNKNCRIVIEKPVGKSLQTCHKIHKILLSHFQENQIFRIDHYLGKESILNLFYLRFSNFLFLKNWNYKSIDHVQITLSESIGISGRWNYFNNTGQIRDMVQNHILQILSILTLPNIDNFNENSLHSSKLEILKNLKIINEKNINKYAVIGQYTENNELGKKIQSYSQESGKYIVSNTETFVALKIYINIDQWKGIPFYIRSGKRLKKKCSKIDIIFKKNPQNIFRNKDFEIFNNILTIYLEPKYGISLSLFQKKNGLQKKYIPEKIQLFSQKNKKEKNINTSNAYEHLILECIKGSHKFFVNKDEVEESWKWIDPIMSAIKNRYITLEYYQAGTWGPISANKLIKKDNRIWLNHMYEKYI